MPAVSVDFLSVGTVRRTITVEVPQLGDARAQLQRARELAAIEMAKDEDRMNAKGTWEVLGILDPPKIDSAPRFVTSVVANTPKTIFG